MFVFVCSLFVLFPAISIPELIQCYHLTTFVSLQTGPPITFHFACLFWLGGFLGCLGFGFVFVCFVVFAVFLMDCDGCWTMYRSFSSPLCGSHP